MMYTTYRSIYTQSTRPTYNGKSARKLRIKRFTLAITVIIGLFIAFGTIVQAISSNDNDSERGIPAKTSIRVIIQPGDTLWAIAKEHLSADMDIRDYVYIIMKNNDLNGGLIQAGDVIEVPLFSSP
ncbi:LysM peptidoglycan-binding domain-containing protein [Paenibacillus sp. UMB4589-SE434]|uniref:LysM peptidoglycan-binding domain-containing protein n=1 Tax=Paenibacillus sp. UMB4589-SE434 TaxID=3046314 RepID=UPI00254AAFC4|nr:LysM peptidoglycan-binding domain-containing protein [Paenibacillus sp. UMB4589-SE434]MDK8180399.1 LysM peptidoglycan-binding domain-containing protein [Paenibacillus sp. UMB4589-SE434]